MANCGYAPNGQVGRDAQFIQAVRSKTVVACNGKFNELEANNITANETLFSPEFIDESNVKYYGAKGDGVTDDTTAIQTAIDTIAASSGFVFFPSGTYIVTSGITLESNLCVQGQCKEDTIIKYTGLNNDDVMSALSKTGICIKDLSFEGGYLAGTRTTSHILEFSTCTDICVRNCKFTESPRETIIFRDSCVHCGVFDCHFNTMYGGSGHIYFLTTCTHMSAVRNYFITSMGGCIWASNACEYLYIEQNRCDESEFELIGIRWDCNYGRVVGNVATQTGDNGISVTGSGFTVSENVCYNNNFAGIAIYGNQNSVTGNILFDNGTVGGNLYAGMLLAAQFGGLASYNSVADNIIFRREGSPAGNQYYGIRISSTSYTSWVTATAYTTGAYIGNSPNLYVATTSGISGGSPPVHTSGIVSDGGVSWQYIGTFENSFYRPFGNHIGINKVFNHNGVNYQDFGVSPQTNIDEYRFQTRQLIETQWSTGVAVSIGEVRFNVDSNGVESVYRAVTAGTTGATPPTHTSGTVSDGTVDWLFIAEGRYYRTFLTRANGTFMYNPLFLNTYDTTLNNVEVVSGTGLPEGTYAAANGSIYIRDNATTPSVWIKTGVTETVNGWTQLVTRTSPFIAFTDGDATPNVSTTNGFNFVTANTAPTTITAFDGGVEGQNMFVKIGDANTTIDFTGTTLKGNAGVDWSPALGDAMRCVFDGTNWICDVIDTTV